jgi:hypothetical protein
MRMITMLQRMMMLPTLHMVHQQVQLQKGGQAFHWYPNRRHVVHTSISGFVLESSFLIVSFRARLTIQLSIN